MLFLSKSPLFVSINQAAEILGVSRSTIDRRIADGTIPSRKLGARVLIAKSAIDAFAQPVVPTNAPEYR